MAEGIASFQEGKKKPSFIKVLFGDLSSTYLRRIPPAFMKNLSEDFSCNARLRVCAVGSWNILLIQTQEGLLMQTRGWENFLQHNSLGDNELLIFTYEGKMNFDVKIFEKNGVRRLNPTATHNNAGQKSSSNKSNTKGKTCKEEVRAENHTEERESLMSEFRGVGSMPNKARETTDAEQREIKTGTKPKVAKMVRDNESVESGGADFGLKEVPEPKNMNKNQARVHGVSSTGFPRFSVEMKKSYVRSAFMVVPRWFAKTYFPIANTEFVLKNQKRNSWQVMYACTETYQNLSRGWSNFVKDNRLKIGGICAFELTGPAELHVSISRSKQK